MGTEIEDRLRRAFAALASAVDVPDTEPELPRRRRWVPVAAVAAAVVVVAGAVAFALSRPDPPPATLAVSTPPRTTAPPSFAFALLTHCGVDEAKVGNTYFEAETPLSGPARSAPAGWDDPYQHGTVTLYPPDAAVFHDARGHEVRFRARPGATGFKHLCD
ncbi:hypothetical protein ACFVYA_41915 [Amycolatopsis sp. NPDC058278]|uniref:hypothetical protein n=1 Tax=Amycolatopsis sp. NPDC058278 TaxID=3346417 RepID=UPI0036DC29FA